MRKAKLAVSPCATLFIVTENASSPVTGAIVTVPSPGYTPESLSSATVPFSTVCAASLLSPQTSTSSRLPTNCTSPLLSVTSLSCLSVKSANVAPARSEMLHTIVNTERAIAEPFCLPFFIVLLLYILILYIL